VGELEILHRPSEGLFLVRLGPGKYAYAKYELDEGKVRIVATYTPPEYRGRGVASRIMRHVANWARENGYKIVPVCSFAVHYFEKNEEFKDLIADG